MNEQDSGCDPKKRNSGLFSFFRWFKPSPPRDLTPSSSCDSINSDYSTASFSFVPPCNYKNEVGKCIAPGPETDTYRARLKQRDKRRERDKNLTLREKYNLFFQREPIEEDNSKSLPLMTRNMEEEKIHRRTASESSKLKKAGAYCHVKGKRRAPQPPAKQNQDGHSTSSLRRKKRLAPQPPALQKVISALKNYDTIEYADADVIFNDSLKLDHGILKSNKESAKIDLNPSGNAEVPVSPRPWYKRNTTSRNEHKYEPIGKLPEVQYSRQSTAAEFNFEIEKKNEKRKSGLTFLTNISELDREASEIIKKEQHKNTVEPPPFMRPKQESPKIEPDTLSSPKRRSARDLIAKFNAITSVTKVTLNTTFLGGREPQKDNLKRDYFGKQEPRKKEEAKAETNNFPLMKSESATAVKAETPKFDRKSWYCPKCSIENDYWRIICHVCSTIKPYFDDLTAPPVKNTAPENNKLQEIKQFPAAARNSPLKPMNDSQIFERVLERSRTQIGFSALAKYNEKKKSEEATSSGETKKEEKERLKKMLIEMKNSLPKRRSALEKQNSRSSVIHENPETPEEKVAEIIIKTTETIYENIHVKKTEETKPIKVSSAVQTTGVVKRDAVASTSGAKPAFELLRPKDFDDIYSDKTGQAAKHIYANWGENGELSLFLNMPKRFADIKNDVNNKDTLEVNRLLRKLEAAIAKGELVEASNLARELAQLKVSCSVIRQKNNDKPQEKKGFMVDMFVEDRISHRGPFPINVTILQTVGELKKQVETEFQIPTGVQRWILGKELANDDHSTLEDHHVTTDGCPVFLYLVANDPKPEATVEDVPKLLKNSQNETIKQDEAKQEDEEIYDTKTLKPKTEWECNVCTLLNPLTSNVCAVCNSVRQINYPPEGMDESPPKTVKKNDEEHYLQLVNLDNADLVENSEVFECLVCFNEILPRQGITLRECLHQFCKLCLAQTVEFAEEAEVKCPYRDNQYSCDIALQDREIKALVNPQIYDQYLAKSVTLAENKMAKSFHCKTPDCVGWCIFEDNVNEFRCPVCRSTNCLTCQAIHTGLNCKQYQEKMKQHSETDEDAKRTKDMVDEMVKKGEALTCPACHVILMKKWGCDWVRCSMCKTEICWVTRGPRWGPAGKGDNSGGCQCGVNGIKCHPQCNYCH